MRRTHAERHELGLPEKSTLGTRKFAEASRTLVIEVQHPVDGDGAPRHFLYARSAADTQYRKIASDEERIDVWSFVIARGTGDVLAKESVRTPDGRGWNAGNVVRIDPRTAQSKVVLTRSDFSAQHRGDDRDVWISELLDASDTGDELIAVVARDVFVNDLENDVAYVVHYAVARIRLSEGKVSSLSEGKVSSLMDLPGAFI